MSRKDDGVYAFSNSELRTWKRCQRKWYFGSYRRLRPIAQEVTGARSLGTRVHLALAVYYSGTFSREEALRAYQDAATADHDAALTANALRDMADFHREVDLGRVMLEGYFAWAEETGADEGLEVVGPEQSLEVPLGVVNDDVCTLRGKLDVRVRRQLDGARLFIDHKTVGSLGQFNATLPLEEQFLTYQLLERLNGVEERSDGGVYNLLKKVKRTVRATPPFYDRIEVRHNDVELRNYYARVHGIVRQILEAERQLNRGIDHRYVTPPNPTRDCSYDCPYLVPCSMMDDGSRVEDMISNYFTTGDPDERYAA